jgi:hypothetical protein
MDVILFLLKIITKLALALTGLFAFAAVALIKALTGKISKKARHNPAPQEPAPRSLVPARTTSQPTPQTPEVHVHVHLNQPPSAPPSPAPTLQPTMQATNGPTHILDRPDHGIYITTGSHLMMEHPRSEELLESLDKMLFIAAHRDGNPFQINPPLDDSRPSDLVQLPPLAELDESVFDLSEPRPLPSPDGALWLRRSGMNPQPLAADTSS